MAKVSLIAKLQTDPEKAEEVEAALAATCSAAEEEVGLTEEAGGVPQDGHQQCRLASASAHGLSPLRKGSPASRGTRS